MVPDSGCRAPNPGSSSELLYYPQSPTRSLPRLILVFWLWWLRTLIGIVSLFAIILADDLTTIFLGSRLVCKDVSQIAPGAWGGALLRLLTSMLLILLLFFFPSLLGGFSSIGVLKSWGFQFLSPGLSFFGLWVLYGLVLGSGFISCGPTISETVLVGFASTKAGLEDDFGLSVNCFFNKFFEPITLLASLFYFDSH